VWWAASQDGRHLYVVTRLKSGKIKRLRREPYVLLAACRRGDAVGPVFEATARIMARLESHPAEEAILRRYGWLTRVFQLAWWLTRQPPVFLEIAPRGFVARGFALVLTPGVI